MKRPILPFWLYTFVYTRGKLRVGGSGKMGWAPRSHGWWWYYTWPRFKNRKKQKKQKNRRVGQYLHLLYSLLTFLLWLLRPSFTVQTLSQAKSTFLSKLNKFKVYVSQKQKNIIKNFIWSNLIFPASKWLQMVGLNFFLAAILKFKCALESHGRFVKPECWTPIPELV